MTNRIALLFGLGLLFGWVGCQTRQSFVLEREAPYKLGEPVHLLKPSSMQLRDAMSVWVPHPLPVSQSVPPVPVATITSIGPANTTPPVLTKTSAEVLRQISAELPTNLPRRAVCLIASNGTVVEVAFLRARDALNERVFSARLRALTFTPATHVGKPVAVICEFDLATGQVGS
ncbi:MAG: hypothetical protein V4773_28825 [Verrucomicrobiota bacterium]